MPLIQQSHFAEESAAFDEKTKAFLAKFENGGLDLLLERWAPVYFAQQTAISEAQIFKETLRQEVLACLDYVSRPREGIPNDWTEVENVQAIKRRYEELFNDDRASLPKPEAVTAAASAQEKFLKAF
ncbi:MAG: hypothetical protein QMC36_08750 [Patescibacteria group bacterium]